MYKTTKQHSAYWKNRDIDWNQAYTATTMHPHRDLILKQLSEWNFGSLFEAGCASGPNLLRIQKAFPHVQLGGCDISDSAIATAQTLLGDKVMLQADPVDKIFHSDKTTDILLTDACLIYIGHDIIDNVLREFKRVTRKHLLLVEFHSTSPIKRLGLKLATGYNAYNYEKLLKKHGFYDIEITKLPDLWDGEPWKTFGHVITASL